MPEFRRRSLLAAVAAAALAAVPAGAFAQPAYPARPVRMVLPFAPGGPTDTLARLLAEQLSARLGGRVIVENRAGAGSTIGADAVAKAPKDGHTLLFNNISHSTNAALYRRLPRRRHARQWAALTELHREEAAGQTPLPGQDPLPEVPPFEESA